MILKFFVITLVVLTEVESKIDPTTKPIRLHDLSLH
jgi:hypothetical protein